MSAEPSDNLASGHPPHAGPEESEPSDGSDREDNSSTNSPDRRWWLTNDILTGALVGSLIAGVLLSGLGLLNLQTVPKEIIYIYVVSVGTAIAWAFGADAVEAWRAGDD